MTRDAGFESPVDLVLLPGMDGTDILFGPLLAGLPGWIRTTVVTYPTLGPNDYSALLPRVLAAIDALPACHVLGWSFSGPLALRAAAARPHRVRSVVLAASFVRAPLRWLPWVAPMIRGPVFGMVRVLRRLPLWLMRPASDPLRRAKARLWREVPARTLATRARAIAGIDVRHELRAAPQPLLYLAARQDRIVRAHNAAQIHRERPDLQLATTDGGHFALFSHAGEASAALGAFLASVARRDHH